MHAECIAGQPDRPDDPFSIPIIGSIVEAAVHTFRLTEGKAIDLHGKERLREQADAPVVEGMDAEVFDAVKKMYDQE